jgi:hypothetical protein
VCGAGADAEEAESYGGEEAACMEPDRAQVSREECVHNLAHPVWGQLPEHVPFPL